MSLLSRTILKWSIFQYLAGAAIGTFSYLFFDMVSPTDASVVVFTAVTSIVSIAITVIFIAYAIRDYERQINDVIGIKNAFLLLGGMFLFTTILGLAILLIRINLGHIPVDAMFIPSMFISQVAMQILFYFMAIMLISLWRVFEKADQPGWASIVPIYNLVVMAEIARKPGSWVVLMFIPLVNIVVGVMLVNAIAKSFGRDEGFTVGLIFLPFIFYPMLAFSYDYWAYGGWRPKDVVDDFDIEEHLIP